MLWRFLLDSNRHPVSSDVFDQDIVTEHVSTERGRKPEGNKDKRLHSGIYRIQGCNLHACVIKHNLFRNEPCCRPGFGHNPDAVMRALLLRTLCCSTGDGCSRVMRNLLRKMSPLPNRLRSLLHLHEAQYHSPRSVLPTWLCSQPAMASLESSFARRSAAAPRVATARRLHARRCAEEDADKEEAEVVPEESSTLSSW